MRMLTIAACRASLALAAALLALAAASLAFGASDAKVPAKDSFPGRIASATGGLKADRGRVTIDLVTSSTIRQTRDVTLELRGLPCEQAKHCVALTGTLKGTLTVEAQQIPDTGVALNVRAAGKVKPLGRVMATGSARGTGFIIQGHERLQLTLTAKRGTVTIDATSGLVPGFSTP